MNTTACTMPTAERPLRLAEFVDGESDDLMLEVSVPPEHRDILKALASRAVEQSA